MWRINLIIKRTKIILERSVEQCFEAPFEGCSVKKWRRGEGATATPIFAHQKMFFLSEDFLPTVQNLGLNIRHFGGILEQNYFEHP